MTADVSPSLKDDIPKIRHPRWLRFKNFQYLCASSGILCVLFFFFGIVAADMLPPLPPSWSAERVKHHFVDNEQRIRGGALLVMVSGTFYLPYSTVISAQMNQMKNAPYLISALQLASGAAGTFTFVLPGVVLGVAAYRMDRSAEAIQSWSDFFWFLYVMPWPSFMTQNFAFAYAILTDQSPRPVFPRFIGYMNFACPLIFLPVTFLHFAKHGPIAWNGGLTFWTVAVVFGLQLIFDSVCLFRAVYYDTDEFDILEALQQSPQNGNGLKRKSSEPAPFSSKHLETTGGDHVQDTKGERV